MLAAIEGEEKERRRVARDLHDGLGAVLATAKMRINALENEIPDIRKMNSFQKAEGLLDEAVSTVREISHNMVPHMLEQYGLEYAIEAMCDHISKTQNLEVTFIPFGLEAEMADMVKVSIYRIIQELLRNVVKHAEASEAIVQISIEQNDLMMIVEDNGKGFDPEKIPRKNRGIGLNSLTSRVQYLGGEMRIESDVTGSTFTVHVPKLEL